MRQDEAQRIIENLRAGIPPAGYVRALTVGRQHEIDELLSTLRTGKPPVTLVQANYGTGKTHLLKLIREMGLADGYVVSTIVIDVKSDVRFNRMDHVLGAALRGMEFVERDRGVQRGLRPFLDRLVNTVEKEKAGGGPDRGFFHDLSSGGTWRYSNVLASPALYVAVRAWATGDRDTQDLVEAWLYRSWDYRSQRKTLYESLVANYWTRFRDPRSDRYFYAHGIFALHSNGYRQSWDILADVHNLARRMGFKGFILLFDEFEDVIQNLGNVGLQEDAFWNLFEFYRGSFPGLCFFAVTPEFNHKTARVFMTKNRDFDFETLANLPRFEMSPLTQDDLIDLARRIAQVHRIAYPGVRQISDTELVKRIESLSRFPVADRVRQTTRTVTQLLDEAVE
jgi:hypothetical protein